VDEESVFDFVVDEGLDSWKEWKGGEGRRTLRNAEDGASPLT